MAFSGSQKTGLKPNALPGKPYGSFAGKGPVAPGSSVTKSVFKAMWRGMDKRMR